MLNLRVVALGSDCLSTLVVAAGPLGVTATSVGAPAVDDGAEGLPEDQGVEGEVPWTGGGTLRVTGNSFATPHVTGMAALVLAKHPGLTPFELKTVLYLIATNVGGGR